VHKNIDDTCCRCPGIRHHLLRDQTHRQPESARRDDEISEITESRNKIGDQVDGAEGVRDYKKDQCFGIPGRTLLSLVHAHGLSVDSALPCRLYY